MTMADDIVAELDRWLELDMPGDDRGILRRARDEILALRQRCALHDDLEFVSKNELNEARAEAWGQGWRARDEIAMDAAAIRALKDKPVKNPGR
jgi:hypothetical protein